MNDENKNLINEDYISQFKKSIFLINTSRGGILHTRALIDALESGKITAAGLDVLENEKINNLNDGQKKDFEYLIQSDRVILTPHTAGWSKESYKRMNEVLIEKIRIFAESFESSRGK